MTWRGETAKAQARLQKHTVLQLVLKPTAVFLTLQISPGMTKFSGKTEKKKNPPVSIQGSAHQLDPGEGGTHRQAVLLPVRQGSEWGSLRATAKYLCELGELPRGLSFPCLYTQARCTALRWATSLRACCTMPRRSVSRRWA